MTIIIDKNFTLHHRYNMRHRNALAIFFAHHSFRISAVRQPHGQLVPLAAQVHHRAVHLETVWSPNRPTTKQYVEPDVHSCQHVLQWGRRGSPASEGPASRFFVACHVRKIILYWQTWGSTLSGFHLSIPTIHLPPEAFRGSSQSGKIPSWEGKVVKYLYLKALLPWRDCSRSQMVVYLASQCDCRGSRSLPQWSQW